MSKDETILCAQSVHEDIIKKTRRKMLVECRALLEDVFFDEILKGGSLSSIQSSFIKLAKERGLV